MLPSVTLELRLRIMVTYHIIPRADHGLIYHILPSSALSRIFSDYKFCYLLMNVNRRHSGLLSNKSKTLSITKTNDVCIAEQQLPKAGDWKVLEVIGVIEPISNRIIIYCHFPFDHLSLNELALGEKLNSKDQIYTLHRDMCKHYQARRGIPRDIQFRVGDSVAAWWSKDNEWYRGIVQSIGMDGRDRRKKFIQVLFVDYGNTEKIESIDVFPLEQKFAELPIQLIECCLSNVTFEYPPARKRFTNELLERVAGFIFVAKVDYVSPEGLVYITQYEMNSTEKISFNELLAKEDYCCTSVC
ncbi:Tudor domain-containing protein 1 [Thelohanellus kitauei]|uniref:Tudor domain-containing protein 1 n=1 Tax=Thelohanellus kitauei TaxID=669202 RepID=A0A0C2J8P7_THEKT|nr:Tudor domain-containing protein 1 [Thelohanellus kitauei]